MIKISQGNFTKLGQEIGEFTDKKNKQYGSSVDVAYEMMLVLMERYRNVDGTYTIPKELIKHMLLQVRIMDKQNRIFNNPSGKGDSENPYKDICGYGLIGINMVKWAGLSIADEIANEVVYKELLKQVENEVLNEQP